MIKIVKHQLQLMENVLQMINAQSTPNSTTLRIRSNVNQQIAQLIKIANSGLVGMVIATLILNAQITRKSSKTIQQRDVPETHAPEFKSSKKLVHALLVQLMKRPLLMVYHVKLMVAHLINSIPQMLCAMTAHAQNTFKQMLTPPKNALQRQMHVNLNQKTLRKLLGLMMQEHAKKRAQNMTYLLQNQKDDATLSQSTLAMLMVLRSLEEMENVPLLALITNSRIQPQRNA